jgi:hypothetical protein
MKKYFCSFEQCEKLRNLGFNEVCFTWYWNDIGLYKGLEYGNHNKQDNCVSAVLKQQAFEFFRNKFLLFYDILLYSNNKWEFTIYGKEVKFTFQSKEYETYEEAEQALIDTLIELATKI